MNKEKFTIPFPDESEIQKEIHQIVRTGLKPKQSFFSYIKSMYQCLGIRQLLSDRSELAFTIIIAAFVVFFYILKPDPEFMKAEDLYISLFCLSPVLFIVLTVYTYSNKLINATYEVEMACKYNVFQIIAFRMLLFSFMTVLANTWTILVMVKTYDAFQFIRAFMISNSGLFIFSILFLYVMMKRRTKMAAGMMIFGWLIGHLLLGFLANELYSALLMSIPLFVYGLILVASIVIYFNFIQKLFHYKTEGGAFVG
ncbi:hypothetical protein [Ureibacillus thermosphaericus]|uniref:hypothetical protein n=1 Tax=Ureibacillus thermosphaericus TaxID=51173 RepID=UPI000BBC8480|nr:hypothetical protein [Ureibacillus thermosphaericus]